MAHPGTHARKAPVYRQLEQQPGVCVTRGPNHQSEQTNQREADGQVLATKARGKACYVSVKSKSPTEKICAPFWIHRNPIKLHNQESMGSGHRFRSPLPRAVEAGGGLSWGLMGFSYYFRWGFSTLLRKNNQLYIDVLRNETPQPSDNYSFVPDKPASSICRTQLT